MTKEIVVELDLETSSKVTARLTITLKPSIPEPVRPLALTAKPPSVTAPRSAGGQTRPLSSYRMPGSRSAPNVVSLSGRKRSL
jgi:hypothetical protein